MSLRARLLVALLALALIPTGIFTLFTLDQLNRAVGRWWYRPGVDRALESALEVAKSSLTRLEAAVLAQSRDRAEGWPDGGLTEAERAEIAASLRSSGVDFIHVYRRAGSGWALAEQVTPAGVIVAERRDLGPAIPAALDDPRVLQRAPGAIAAAAPLPGGDVLVAGMWVAPDFHSQVATVVQGATYYRQLGVTLDLQRWLLWLLVGAVVLGLVTVAVVLASAFSRAMSRPLAELSSAFGEVSAGNLAARVTPRGARELRSLGASFNEMSARLEAARDALQSAEREAAWRDVARKLAHEFKNMLTPMQLSLQLLECDLNSAAADRRDAMRDSLQAALREVAHLNRLAEQFSQYARLPEPRFERVDLNELVRAAAAAETAAEVRVEAAPEGAAVIRGDRLLLSRAVHNLLLNACEASPAGAAVELRVRAEPGRAAVEVLDRGPGVPEELRPRLFEPYVSTKKRGSGLGLSLVRDIARQHGGAVSIESRPDGGTRALLSLPDARGAAGEAAGA